MSVRYQPRTPAVVHEVFDDEVVIVNLDSGDYYSLSEAGVECWNCVVAGFSIDETIESVRSRYEGNHNLIRKSTINLFEQLEEEKLVVPLTGARGPPADRPVDRPDGEKPIFVSPVLTPYSDMRDLLLIDPIHEVDEAGWPEATHLGDGPSE